MTLCYDFDIFEIAPKNLHSDIELGDFLKNAGLAPASDGGAVALFRDGKTADALCRAPEALRDYFLNSGFGLNTFASGAPTGRYPVQDEEARLAIIERLTENAAHHRLPSDPVEEGEFSLHDFLDQLAKATPFDLEAMPLAVDAIGPAIPKDQPEPRSGQGSLVGHMARRLLQGVPLLRQFRRASAQNV